MTIQVTKEFDSLDFNEKTDLKVELWKKKLLDLTKRNPRINFKPSRKSYIEILKPNLYELYKKVITLENNVQSIDFKEIFNPKKYSDDQIRKDLENLYPNIEFNNDNVFKDYKKQYLRNKHQKALKKILSQNTFTSLITNLDDAEIDRRIRLLNRKNKSHLEEKGLNCLYICFGLLKWREYKQNKGYIRSPLVFVPIILKKNKKLKGNDP